MAETDDADAPEPQERRFKYDVTRKAPDPAPEKTPMRLADRLAPVLKPAAPPPESDASGDDEEDYDDGEDAVEEAVAETSAAAAPPPPRPAAPPPPRAPLPRQEPQRPIAEETLASMVAGRTLETEEEERTFLLTLSRDQRLKYAELLAASDRLDLDRETQNLEYDRIQLERDKMRAEERDRYRVNAFAFAAAGIRTLLAINGAGAIMLLAVWGYLAALPKPPFAADAFVLALAAFGIGTVASAFTALAAYGVQAVQARTGHDRLRRSAAETLRILALVLVAIGFFAFLAGILLAGHGLRAG